MPVSCWALLVSCLVSMFVLNEWRPHLGQLHQVILIHPRANGYRQLLLKKKRKYRTRPFSQQTFWLIISGKAKISLITLTVTPFFSTVPMGVPLQPKVVGYDHRSVDLQVRRKEQDQQRVSRPKTSGKRQRITFGPTIRWWKEANGCVSEQTYLLLVTFLNKATFSVGSDVLVLLTDQP